jgi:hypothetical protein
MEFPAPSPPPTEARSEGRRASRIWVVWWDSRETVEFMRHGRHRSIVDAALSILEGRFKLLFVHPLLESESSPTGRGGKGRKQFQERRTNGCMMGGGESQSLSE